MKPGKDYIGVGCGALILNEQGQTLLIKRGKGSKNQAGVWSKPGGTVEFGENIKDAVKREIKEELGIEIELFDFLGITDHIIKNEGQHWIAVHYLARVVSGIPQIMEPEKCSQIEWFDLDKLPTNITTTTLEPLETYKKIIKRNKT